MNYPIILALNLTKNLRNPRFRAFRAQNRHFCVRNGDISLVLSPSEHKIGIFVRFCWEPDHRQREPGGWQREPDHRQREPGGWQRVNGSLVPR